MKIVSKICKALLLVKTFLQECFSQCLVVKMSAYFNEYGKFLIANWGDDINYWFLSEISEHRIISYDWSLRTRIFRKPYVLGIGSILTMFDISNSIVWGSGILRSDKPFNGRPKQIRAVRGPLTRQKLLECGIECPEVYGDPALLLPLYYQPNVNKRYKLGIIQQHKSINNPLLDSIRYDSDVLVLKIGQYEHWLDFVDEVCMCETIISSSLHGLILAEAYKIPNVWTYINGDNPEDFFKYHDFFLSIGKDREPLFVYEPLSREVINEKMNDWNPSSFDISPLLESCPFPLKKNHTIKK